ncbi:hypothetical protein ABZS86_22750 [Streptomyces sp. NPDC005355]|uniref:hypothetical protein n=1 Tax=Streptomyces sp. NPDC005355 TaxID=3157038 RepID=UPI0033A5F67C
MPQGERRAKQAYTRGLSDYERFMSYVDTSDGPDACHPWGRYINDTGYGEFDVTENGRQRKHKATRWLMGYLRGKELGPDEEVMHEVCDNPPCLNRRHLTVATHAENVADMVRKGRGYKGKTHCKRRHEHTPENTYIEPSTGRRQCRACWAVRREEKRAARSTPASGAVTQAAST